MLSLVATTLIVGSAGTTLCSSLAARLTQLTPLVQIRIVRILPNHLERHERE